MTAVDTSLAVAAMLTWHEAHEEARRLVYGATIPAHARLESFSVLTRLPAPHRIDASDAVLLIRERFPREKTLVPSKGLSSTIVERCFEARVEGGAVYDALVGLTAADSGLTLVTRDRRAAATYERLDIDYELIA